MAVDLVGPAMQGVLDCVDAALTDSVGLKTLVPGGEVAWDNCCEDGGELYVRLISTTPAGQQPNCAPTHWNALLGVGIVRCAHSLTDQGFPTAAQMTGDARKMTQDQIDIYEGLICCAESVTQIQKKPTIGTWNPVGALGTCAGGEWQVTVNVGTCECP